MTDLFNLDPLMRDASALLDAASEAGADSADAVVARSLSMAAEVRNGALDETEHAESDVMGLRVFCGKRSAIVSTGEFGRTDWRDLAERAVAMAKAAPEDVYAGLADHAETGAAIADLDLLDDSMPSIGTLEDRARACEEACLSVSGVTKSAGSSASFGLSGIVLVTSSGFSGGYLRSRHGVSAGAVAGEGTNMQRDYDFSAALHAEDLLTPEQVGSSAGERAVRRLNPAKADSGRGTIVFDPRVSARLAGYLASAANGVSVAKGTSMLKDKLGEAVFDPRVTIVDEPLRVRGLASRPFDGEGLPARALTLVDQGVLSAWLLDSAAARELGMASNAHAARSAGSGPSPGTTNLTLLPGETSREDLLSAAGDGIYVTELIGRGGNTVTGDFSCGAAGFRIANGELTEPVAEITVAGNLTDMFARMVPANDLEYRFATNAPTLMIEGMTIAGR